LSDLSKLEESLFDIISLLFIRFKQVVSLAIIQCALVIDDSLLIPGRGIVNDSRRRVDVDPESHCQSICTWLKTADILIQLRGKHWLMELL